MRCDARVFDGVYSDIQQINTMRGCINWYPQLTPTHWLKYVDKPVGDAISTPLYAVAPLVNPVTIDKPQFTGNGG